ncbi:hypothetical protein ACFFTM_16490 [Pseudoduganella plicata]|uniref:Uncharacterized protein n=1 Tax=Pseudoduganella plicata TaxID=321984 RepID=A0A4P7BMM8_9BURK|nr:hypothetical protein [Pseudoduganella plicata]QBQ39005.1 hypothetical protein E1742_24790 [Pseudoduganella plicata]GGY86416.1 hypothetical protein GCM10007388_19570 [Pseudoduganella plicata]
MSQTATSPADIEALADSLSASANELHASIMRAIRRNGTVDDAGADAAAPVTHAEAQALFEQEVELRQRANSLYVDSARYAVAGLEVPAQEILRLAAQARETIRRIDRAKDIAGIVAALLGLAGAVVGHQPKDAAAALEDLKDNLAAFKVDSRKPDHAPTMKT